MAIGDEEVIEIHNKADEEDGVLVETVKGSWEGVKKTAKDIKDTASKANERYRKDTGFNLWEDPTTMTPEEVGQRLDEAQKNKDIEKEKQEVEKEKVQKEKERLEELKKEYIVSGARIVCSGCSQGDQPMDASYVVVPVSHGTYIHGLSQLNITDCTAENIKKFGCCHSKENPKVVEAAKKVLKETLEERKKGFMDRCMDFLTGASNKIKTNVKDGLAEYCAAECIFENEGQWKDGKSDVLIDGEKALLGKCTLQCKYGGTIKLYSNGLENAEE